MVSVLLTEIQQIQPHNNNTYAYTCTYVQKENTVTEQLIGSRAAGSRTSLTQSFTLFCISILNTNLGPPELTVKPAQIIAIDRKTLRPATSYTPTYTSYVRPRRIVRQA